MDHPWLAADRISRRSGRMTSIRMHHWPSAGSRRWVRRSSWSWAFALAAPRGHSWPVRGPWMGTSGASTRWSGMTSWMADSHSSRPTRWRSPADGSELICFISTSTRSARTTARRWLAEYAGRCRAIAVHHTHHPGFRLGPVIAELAATDPRQVFEYRGNLAGWIVLVPPGETCPNDDAAAAFTTSCRSEAT